MKKIIVTGGLGFIGSNLIDILIKKNFFTVDIQGLSFNPLRKKWKRSNDLSVNYIICSKKN